MEKMIFETGPKPKVIVTSQSNLTLKGTDDLEVVVKIPDPEAVEIQQDGEIFTIKASDVCTIRVPRDANVEIETSNSDTMVKALDGDLSIKNVAGNLELRSVSQTHLVMVNGNLQARNVMGDLTIERVEGNAVLRDVQGDCKITDLKGNLQISELDGGLEAQANGNIGLSLDPSPGKEYNLTAHGNITYSLSEDASVEISIERAGHVALHIPGYEETRNIQAPYQLMLGDGDAEMKLNADGNVVLSSHMPHVEIPDINVDLEGEFEGMAEAFDHHINQQIQAQLEMIEQQIQSQVANMTLRMGAAGMTPEQMERVQQRAREAGERAAARAQEKVQRAQERLERRMSSVQQRMEQKTRQAQAHAQHRPHHTWNMRFPTPPEPPSPPEQAPVSEEERLVILRMLEQKKISLEEAEKLLSALEGKES